MPRCAATRRASSMSRGPQQRPPTDAAVPRASYSRSVIPMTRCPCSTRTAAAVALSTPPDRAATRSEEHTSELQSQSNLVCRLLLEKKKKKKKKITKILKMSKKHKIKK